MEAGFWLRRLGCAVFALLLSVSPCFASAGNHRTRNFIIQAPSQQLAVAVGNAAEKFRRELAIYWTGRELPPWPRPCPIRVVAGNLAAQGVTTYNPRPVSDFQMEVIGTPERILDSVLPHEVTHTVLATHFGRPLPRWADEGICTTVEHPSEKDKHETKLREFLASRRGIAMNQLFLMTEYPQDVLPMYAQGYSVCRFLIEQQGPRTFINFLGDYMRRPSWTQNVRKHYGYESLLELQNNWLAWVKSGSGDVTKFAKLKTRGEIALAAASIETPSVIKPAVADSRTPATATLAGAISNTANGWQPNDSPYQRPQAGASPAPAKQHPQARPADPASLASQGAGWYSRLREQHSREETGGLTASAANEVAQTASTAAGQEPIMPPSVRQSGTYSTAQPPAEQQWSRGPAAGGYGEGRRWR